ncbi:ATP-binding protein [Streptomyces sp. RKND-216]|uniref:ATP-binding protein n=1 Tax=Streptomyces sp. RKND-216 TaxID=2562581 RepID=UPI001FFB3427|nr:ATP-binding protein [Streptomyces sp. RKND-216]
MTSEFTSPVRPGLSDRRSDVLRPARHFSMLFSSTPRGVRLARRLAGEWLDTWGLPYGGTAHDALTLIVAELCNNAACHGRVAGRDFRLDLSTVGPATVRVEVTDTRSERIPVALTPPTDSTRGRGLVLVNGLASRWDYRRRVGAPGKTVWAEYDVNHPE